MSEPQEPEVRSDLSSVEVDQISSSPDEFYLHLKGEYVAPHYTSPFDHSIRFDRQGLIDFAQKILEKVAPDDSMEKKILQALDRIEEKMSDLD